MTSEFVDPAYSAPAPEPGRFVVRPYPVAGGSADPATEVEPAFAFHQVARMTGRQQWWRPLLGTGVVLVGALSVILVVALGADAAGALLDRPRGDDGFRTWGEIGDTAVLLLAIALLTPVVLFAARWVQQRPAGTVSSVAGRLRWRWLAICLGAALPLAGALLLFQVLRPGQASGTDDAQWVGLSSFLLGLAVVCALVPFQAAGEEYVFRGWLVQAIGAWGGSPWVCALPQAVLFAAVHGWGTPWGFIDLTVFGLVAGLLTIRTGGLEAAVALHVVTNLLALGIASAIVGGLSSEETSADMDWLLMAIDIPVILAYAAVVLWLARRRQIGAVRVLVAPEAPAPPMPMR